MIFGHSRSANGTSPTMQVHFGPNPVIGQFDRQRSHRLQPISEGIPSATRVRGSSPCEESGTQFELPATSG
jgi:hypothetical protein